MLLGSAPSSKLYIFICFAAVTCHRRRKNCLTPGNRLAPGGFCSWQEAIQLALSPPLQNESLTLPFALNPTTACAEFSSST